MRHETLQFLPKYPVLCTGRTGTQIRTWAKRNCSNIRTLTGI